MKYINQLATMTEPAKSLSFNLSNTLSSYEKVLTHFFKSVV